MLLQSVPASARSGRPCLGLGSVRPPDDRPWTLKWAAHLYRERVFRNRQQLEQALAEGPQRTVDRLVRPYEDASARRGGRR